MPSRILLSLLVPFVVLFNEGAARAGEHYWGALRIERPSQETSAADFTLPDLQGKKVRLKDFRGKVVFLNFWATWCIPCRTEMPGIEQLYREFRDKGLVVLAVNFREDLQAITPFVKELQLTFPILLDRDGEVARRYRVFGIPKSYLVGQSGEVLGRVVGDRNWASEEAKGLFRSLLTLSRKP